MAVVKISCVRCSLHLLKKGADTHNIIVRWSNTLYPTLVDRHRRSDLLTKKQALDTKTDAKIEVPRDFRFVHPEFLPSPIWFKRDKLTEYLERRDMYRRRGVIDIPEFYVGSIMAVTVADKHAQGKNNKFVGICILRRVGGIRAGFILRNVINGQGIEIYYDMYSPLLQKIEVIKLEKRLDDELLYLRDAPQGYSTIPFDMAPMPLPKGSSVPVNTTKVNLNPRPWLQRWERCSLNGVEELDLSEKLRKNAKKAAKPWEKYDLMKQYRGTINEYDKSDIIQEFYEQTQHDKSMFAKKD